MTNSPAPLVLYYCPGTCAFVPMLALELAGAQYTPHPIDLRKGEHKTPQYLAVHPAGQVPALSVGEDHLIQLVAIVDYLAGQFPHAEILPAEPIARARAMATLVWFNSTVHATFGRIFHPEGCAPDEAAQAAVRSAATAQYARLLDEIEARYQAAQQAGAPWLSGARAGVLDAYALCCVRWGELVGLAAADRPQLLAQLRKLADEPAFARAIAREGLPLP